MFLLIAIIFAALVIGIVWIFRKQIHGSGGEVVVNVATLCVVSFYTWFAYQQTTAIHAANDDNTKNTYVIQRPFIYSPGMGITPLVGKDGITELALNPTIVNGGNTPPTKLSIYINYYTPTDEITPAYTFPDLQNVTVQTGAGGPKDAVRISSQTYSTQDLADFADHKRHLYVYGHIEYDDAFVGSPHHVTLYCWELTGIVGDPNAFANLIRAAAAGAPVPAGAIASISLNFPACQEHNCTDDGCKAQG